MLNSTNVQQKSSDQHHETSCSRQKRDCSDTQNIIDFLQKVIPFKGGTNVLRNIVTGMVSSSNVNVEVALSVGDKIMSKMTGRTIQEFIPRRVDQCVLMTTKGTQLENEKHSHVDPDLLFQRLVTVARRSDKDESLLQI